MTIQSVSIHDEIDMSYDYTRATCFNGNGSSAKAITMAYSESCTIVYKFQPSSYQPESWFDTYVKFKDNNGNLVNSNVVNTPYLSVGAN